MDTLSTGETIFLGAFALLLLFWMKPGIKAAFASSSKVKSDWMSALLPLGIVLLFVAILVFMVKG